MSTALFERTRPPNSASVSRSERAFRRAASLLVTVALASAGVVTVASPAAAAPEGSTAWGTGGSVVTWGSQGGVLGVPSALSGKSVTALATGYNHVVALDSDGSVTAWGSNPDGRATVPTAKINGRKVTAIGAGAFHSLAVTEDGKVIGWGLDSDGQATPPASLDGKSVTAVAGGRSYSMALASDGTVTAWGDNSFGQLDIPAALSQKRVTAISAGSNFGLALTDDGQVTAWGDNGSFGSATVPESLSGKTVVAIAAGAQHALALDNTGKVYAWGFYEWGLTTVPASLDGKQVSAIAAGPYNSLALTTDGQITAWGLSSPYGQTAPPVSVTGTTALGIAATLSQSFAILGPLPLTMRTSPADVTVADGQTATLSASADGAVTGIQWQSAAPSDDRFLDIPGANSATYTTGPLTASQSGTRYRVAFSNPSTQAVSSPATVTVVPTYVAPSISGAPVNGTVGTAYTYGFVLGGSPAPTVRVIDGALPHGLALDTATGVVSGTPTTAGSYSFRLGASNCRGSECVEASHSASISILPAAAQADLEVTVTGPTNVRVGSKALFSVKVTNRGPKKAINLATAVSLSGAAPAAGSPSSGTVTVGGTTVSGPQWTRASLASGASVTYTIVGTATGKRGSLVVATAASTAATADPKVTNNVATVTATIK